MIDLALDTEHKDLIFKQGLRGWELAFVSGAPAMAQRVVIRLKSILNEWFLDQRYGLPWFDSILVKNPNPILITTLIRREVMKVPGVTKITRLDLVFDKVARTAGVLIEFSGAEEDQTVNIQLTGGNP